MKKLLLGFLAAVCATAAWAAPAQEKVEFAIFVSPSCVHCKHFENEYLPVLQEKYKDSVHFVIYDISKDGNNLILAETAKAHGKRPAYPTALVGDTYMVGYPHEIKTYAEAAIEKAQLLQQKTQVSTQKQDTQTAFKKITFWAIIGAGLVDGINPCAFAVIVFFVSFLTVYKYTRKEVIVVGTSYCVAVFIAYVLIGLGLFQFLYAMRGFYWVIKAFYWITALLCLGFFVLSLYDFWIYQKTKKSDKMLLQLPPQPQGAHSQDYGLLFAGKARQRLAFDPGRAGGGLLRIAGGGRLHRASVHAHRGADYARPGLPCQSRYLFATIQFDVHRAADCRVFAGGGGL